MRRRASAWAAAVTLVLLSMLASESGASAQRSIPAAPERPTATAVFIGGVDLEWSDVHGADSYDVQSYLGGNWVDLPEDGVEISFYGAGAIISGLDPTSSLWFRTRARNYHGSSGWSDWVQLASTNQHTLGRRPRPENVPASGAPTIEGSVQVGETLTSNVTGIEDENGLARVRIRFQWVASTGDGDTDIPGATDSSYTLVAADEGKTVKVRVAFTDRGGYAESLVSVETEQVTSSTTGNPAPMPQQAQNNPATGAPAITGIAQVGETLTADTAGIADADGLNNATFSYQWIANDGSSDSDITGATNSTYTLVEADEGKTIKVRVTFADDSDNDETLTSNATVAVAAAEEDVIWSVQMTMKDYGNGSVGADSADLFSNETGRFRIKWLWHYEPLGNLYLAFEDAVADTEYLTLRFGDYSLAFPSGDSSFKFADVDVSWAADQTLAVWIVPQDPPDAP